MKCRIPNMSYWATSYLPISVQVAILTLSLFILAYFGYMYNIRIDVVYNFLMFSYTYKTGFRLLETTFGIINLDFSDT